MKISKIYGVQNIKSNKINPQSKVVQNPVKKQLNANDLFRLYLGRDMVSFGSKPFSQTLKDNYFQLPSGCYPDAFQIDAGKALLEGKDVLVEAPTGTGKTAIAHYVATKNMEEGKTTFYTTPLKALSNQKLNEFREVYGDENVGILTGDRRENVDAPIVIMTTEVYRNMAISNMYGDKNPLMDNLATVIFDEFHYLGDPDRGPVWEESVMYTPKNVQTLELSATIGNPKDLKNWIGSLKDNNVTLVSIPSEARHVPLSFDMFTTRSYEKAEKRIQKAIRRGETPDLDDKLTVKKPKLTDFKSAVEFLKKEEQLPAIFFIFSKKYSREVLEYFAKDGEDLTTPEEKEEIQKILNKYTNSEKYIGADLDTKALEKGYAIHNAGIIPGQKELIEELFQKKLLKAVIATETLAAGINMPAKTVVISSPYKPCDEDADIGKLLDEDGVKLEVSDEEGAEEEQKTPVRMLTSNEFKQMSGRAGRRGIDTVGYVYTMPTDRNSEQDFLYLEAVDCNPINSNYNPDYSFLSGYYEHNATDKKLEGMYDKSFYAYSQDTAQKEAKMKELKEIGSRKTQILLDRGFLYEREGYIEPTILSKMASTVKGYDALTLTEAISSKVFNGITPEALAMVASSIAIQARSNDSCIGVDTDLAPIMEKAQQSTLSLREKLYNSVNSMLSKVGKSLSDFSSYEEVLDFAYTIEKPQASEEELVAKLRKLEEIRSKFYKVTKNSSNYSASEVVKALKNCEVVPTQALESLFKSVETYKKRINSRSIDAYIEKLQAEYDEIDTSQKGTKAKARLERQQKEIRASIQTAEDMKFLDENIPNALSSNHKFLKHNPQAEIKAQYQDTQMKYAKLLIADKLVDKVKALQSLEDYCVMDVEDEDEISLALDYDIRKADDVYKMLFKKSGEIFETEVKNGINPQRPKYSKDAAQSGYAWAMLNGANDNDSMENWAQLLRMTSENVDEGSLYRNVMQTADLLSQIAEMAQVGAKESVNVNDKEYYSNLKDTAHQARNLILQKPAEM